MIILFSILASVVTAVGFFLTLNWSLDQIGLRGDALVTMELIATVVVFVLLLFACFCHWIVLGPVVVILLGIWQMMSYTDWAWLTFVGLCLASLMSHGGNILTLVFGNFMLFPLSVFLFVFLSNRSLEQDKRR